MKIYHGLLVLIREVKDWLEELQMYEAPDRLLLAAHVRNMLLAANGRLSLLDAASKPTTPGSRRWSVGDRIIELRYPQKYVDASNERIHGHLTQIGKLVAKAYRRRHSRAPMRTTRYVDGAPRQICVYLAADLDLLDGYIEEILGTPPAMTAVRR
jgi:hypothetical protein